MAVARLPFPQIRVSRNPYPIQNSHNTGCVGQVPGVDHTTNQVICPSTLYDPGFSPAQLTSAANPDRREMQDKPFR